MTLVDARAPALAPGVELLGELAGSGYESAPGLVRRGDGQTCQLTPLLYALLGLLDGQRSTAELALLLSDSCGKAVTSDDVEHLLSEKLAPLGVLADEDGRSPVTEKATPLLGLKLKVVVSDPTWTSRLTAPFGWLFSRWVVIPVLLAFAATTWWVLWEKGLAQPTRQAFYEPGLLLAVFLLTVLSAGFHELGHAAACRAAGARPGAMGAGLYLVWPAFYTDVDDSYRLSRWGRLKVDLGGLYFNALVAVGVMALWWVTRTDALLLGIATQLLQMLRQLAPVIRADGYHILADLTGVPDLFAHLKPTLTGLLPQNWGRPQPLRRWARVVVTTWVLVVVPVLLGLLVVVVLALPRLLATAAAGLGRQGDALQAAASAGDAVGVIARLLSIAALVVPVLAIGYVLARLVRSTATGVWRATTGRPVARAGALLAGAALLALAAWAWWPSGQYDPVRSDERGTVGSLGSVAALGAVEPVALAGDVTGSIPEGATRTTALALVPKDGDAPAVLLVRQGDGSLRTILASEGTGTAFPFALPDAPGEGDNQALAVNDVDGSTVYDVAVALVWVRDGEVVGSRNEAYALASCRSCTTVAVAFQVVLVVGQTDAIAPVNAAVAANGDCVECVTAALAVQLVATLEKEPSAEVEEQIEQVLAGLDGLAGSSDVYAQVAAVEQELLRVLVDNGLVEPPTVTPTLAPTTEPSTAPGTASPSASSSPMSSGSPSPTPSPTSNEPTAPVTASSEPTAAAEPTSSPEPTPSASG